SSSDEKGEPEIGSLPFMRLVPETKNTQFRLYRVDSPSTIGATTTAPLVVVIGSRSDYDRVARLLFDDGASPRTRVPVWWSGTVADLPDDLVGRAASVIVVGGHLPYHAQSKANAAERRYVVSFLGDAATGAETAARWRFVDPERREIETDGAAVLFKESIYPKWSARFVGVDGTQRAL